MTGRVLLTFNQGSSTIKLGLFIHESDALRRLGSGMVELRQGPLLLHVVEGAGVLDVPLKADVSEDMHEVVEETLGWLMQHFSHEGVAAVGHRVVHGGDHFDGPVEITDQTLAEIAALVPLAPLHQPQSVRLIRAIRRLFPELPQFVSFDTAFHRSQSDLVRRFALPRALFDQGVKRYGFHGLSYKFISGQLKIKVPDLAAKKIVVAHLGSGASLCALSAGVSRDTTMSFSTLDGIPMATRCGAVDPGVLIHLIKQEGWSVEKLEQTLYHDSGLLGVSGISADTRDLLTSDKPEAREALDLFAFRIARETAAMATTLGGLDGLVFTAGIGEHQPEIRAAICQHLGWLGAVVDPAANAAHAMRIDVTGSRIALLVIPTDEEQTIADEAWSLFTSKESHA